MSHPWEDLGAKNYSNQEPFIGGYPLWSGIPDKCEGNMNPSESLNMIMNMDNLRDANRMMAQEEKPRMDEIEGGKQTEYASGMRRDNRDGKPDYTLIPRFMLDRVVGVMQPGAEKYGRESWKKACTEEELEHFKQSAWRHFLAWMDDEQGWDHYASLIFNLNGAELVKTKLLNQKS